MNYDLIGNLTHLRIALHRRLARLFAVWHDPLPLQGMNASRSYTGIGSRSTPPEVLERLRDLAAALAREGYELRSGAADGADMACEEGCDRVAKPHGQHRLRALQRLALALLVHAQHQRVLRRTQVQADDIAQLLDEERIVGQLEALGAMRLQAEQLEVAQHAGLGNAGLRGNRSHIPMRRPIGGLGVQRRLDQLRDSLIVDRTRLARTNVVLKAGDTPFEEAHAPLAHRGIGRWAIELFASPSALLRIMRARSLSAAGNERLRANDCSCDRSTSLNTSSVFGLPMPIAVSPSER